MPTVDRVTVTLPSKVVREIDRMEKNRSRFVLQALRPGPSGLAKTSYALIDHIRSVDKRRVRRVFGQVSATEMNMIDEGLSLFLGL